jgi:hypothetical protein
MPFISGPDDIKRHKESSGSRPRTNRHETSAIGQRAKRRRHPDSATSPGRGTTQDQRHVQFNSKLERGRCAGYSRESGSRSTAARTPAEVIAMKDSGKNSAVQDIGPSEQL